MNEIIKRWDVVSADSESPDLETYLTEAWEPFSATSYQFENERKGGTVSGELIWLRRERGMGKIIKEMKQSGLI